MAKNVYGISLAHWLCPAFAGWLEHIGLEVILAFDQLHAAPKGTYYALLAQKHLSLKNPHIVDDDTVWDLAEASVKLKSSTVTLIKNVHLSPQAKLTIVNQMSKALDESSYAMQKASYISLVPYFEYYYSLLPPTTHAVDAMLGLQIKSFNAASSSVQKTLTAEAQVSKPPNLVEDDYNDNGWVDFGVDLAQSGKKSDKKLDSVDSLGVILTNLAAEDQPLSQYLDNVKHEEETVINMIPLSEATIVGQKTYGTSTGSVYTSVAISKNYNMSARYSGGTLSVRVCPTAMSSGLGELAKISPFTDKGEYVSCHLNVAPHTQETAAAILGSLIYKTMPYTNWEYIVMDLSIIAGFDNLPHPVKAV